MTGGVGVRRGEDVAVVARASVGRAECRVGFADADEFLRCVGIVGVEIGVGGFGELVELSSARREWSD